MWDYDKLFAIGNIVGIKDTYKNVCHCCLIDEDNQPDYDRYRNNKLKVYASCVLGIPNSYSTDFEIQYIIRLDEHGNVVEKLFDRERDMKPETEPMPELETGMFVRVTENNNMKETVLGYVDVMNCRIIYQDGKYNNLVNMEKLKGIVDIVEVYSIKTLCFNRCFSNETLIWRSPEYQSYLDSKASL